LDGLKALGGVFDGIGRLDGGGGRNETGRRIIRRWSGRELMMKMPVLGVDGRKWSCENGRGSSRNGMILEKHSKMDENGNELMNFGGWAN
jgi:hypothetical protein